MDIYHYWFHFGTLVQDSFINLVKFKCLVSVFKFRFMPILNFRCITSESCQVRFGMRDYPRQKKSYWVELSVHAHGTWKKSNGPYVRTRCMPAVFSLYVWVSLSISKLFYLFDFESKTLLVCQMCTTHAKFCEIFTVKIKKVKPCQIFNMKS